MFAHDEVDSGLGQYLDFTNGYGGALGQTYYYVVAGSPTGDSSTGELFINSASVSTGSGQHFSHYDLAGHGPLTIQSANLPDIVVSAADGTTFAFDVIQHTFTSR